MPLTDGTSQSVAANSTANVISGRPLEFMGQAVSCTLLLVADAALQQGQFIINVGANQMVPIASGFPLPVASAAGAGPRNDEDVIAVFALPQGARSQLNITNTTGGAVISRYRAILS